MDEDNFDERARLKRLQDFNDLQAENAGLNTGKMLRFTSRDQTPQAKAHRERQGWTDLLTMQITSERMRERLAELDRASFRALKAAERRAAETCRDLEDIQGRATIDDQGRRIYLTQDRERAFYENGVQLSPDQKAK